MQINRLIDMLFILLSRETVTAKEFAEKFGVSHRTVYRDVDALTLANIPITMTKGKRGGISLLKNFKLDKALLSDAEKGEVMSSLQIFGSLAPEKNGAIEKLRAIFDDNQNNWLEIDFDYWSDETGQKQLFADIKAAVVNRRQIQFTYHSSSGKSLRTVNPLKLCFKGQSWYLYAYCLIRHDYRFFKLNRIKDCKILHKSFEQKAPQNVLQNLSGYNDTFIDLTLQIDKAKAYRVYDEFTDYTVLDSGDFLVKCRLPLGDWLYQYIISYLGDCKVLEPKDIGERVKQIYQTALTKY